MARLRENKRVNGYTIVRPSHIPATELFCELNVGNNAICYKAVNLKGAPVFFKQYKSPSPLLPWFSGYVDYQKRFKQIIDGSDELQTLTYQFIDFFVNEADETYYQAFEWIENGKDLRHYLDQSESLNVGDRITFASLFMYTMNEFHRAGIIHCDLKPENLLLFPADCEIGYNLRLVDFDRSILADTRAPWHGSEGYCGTPGYMSPEHIRGEVPTSASDIFTCGLILYELLDRNGHPYLGMMDDYNDAILERRAEPPQFLESHGAAADRPLRGLIYAALSPEPESRPTARELHGALLNWKKSGGETVSAPAVAPPAEVAPEAPPAPPPPASRPAPDVSSLTLKSQDSSLAWGPIHLKTPFGVRVAGGILPPGISKYYSSSQFTLEVDEKGAWFVVPDNASPNATVHNGLQIGGRTRLANGDVLAVGSRRDANIVIGKMDVLLTGPEAAR